MPEDQREAMVSAIGEGVLRQDESSRLVDEATAKAKSADERQVAADKKFEEVEAWHGQINTWWGGEQERIKRLEAAAEGVTPQPRQGNGDIDNDDDDPTSRRSTPAPPAGSPNYVTQESLQEALGNFQAGIARQGATLVGALHDMHLKHQQEFGTDFFDSELFAHCDKVKRPADQGGYESFVLEMRKEKGETDRKKLVEDAELRGEERAMERLSSGTPYPVGGAPAFAGTLRHLGSKEKGTELGTDAAVRTVMKMRQAKASGLPTS